MDEFKDNIKKDSSLPLVSILIPLYNAEQYIGGLLDWCLRQPYKNIEVVVVDDHSTDNSYSIAKKYESDRVHVLPNGKVTSSTTPTTTVPTTSSSGKWNACSKTAMTTPSSSHRATL